MGLYEGAFETAVIAVVLACFSVLSNFCTLSRRELVAVFKVSYFLFLNRIAVPFNISFLPVLPSRTVYSLFHLGVRERDTRVVLLTQAINLSRVVSC